MKENQKSPTETKIEEVKNDSQKEYQDKEHQHTYTEPKGKENSKHESEDRALKPEIKENTSDGAE